MSQTSPTATRSPRGSRPTPKRRRRGHRAPPLFGGHQSGGPRRGPSQRGRPLGLLPDELRWHAESVGFVPPPRGKEVRLGFHLQPLWCPQRGALQRSCRHQSGAVAPRGVEEGGRGVVLHVSPPSRAGRDGLPLLHGQTTISPESTLLRKICSSPDRCAGRRRSNKSVSPTFAQTNRTFV